MKKIAVILLALITFQVNAQDKKGKRMQFEPQEMAQIQTKKMTLHLDLSEAQQKKIMALNLKNAEKRKAAIQNRLKAKESSEKAKPTKAQKLKSINAKLDAKIETKKEMKAILNADQYKKWETSMEQKSKRKAGMKRKAKMKKAHKKNKD